MAKLNALNLVNAVLKNIGESTVTGLTGLTTIQLLVFDKLNEAIIDICTDQTCQWQFLESVGVVPMTTGSYQYLITSLATGSDMMREDRESFRQYDSGYKIDYVTPQEFDALYPKGITTDRTGYPDKYTKYQGYLVFNKQAAATQNGKNIDFRYWKLPVLLSTDTSTGTCDIPEPFDRTCLVALATLKVLAYLKDEEAAVYKIQVFGDGEEIEGSFEKLKEIYSSPALLPGKNTPRMTYQF